MSSIAPYEYIRGQRVKKGRYHFQTDTTPASMTIKTNPFTAKDAKESRFE